MKKTNNYLSASFIFICTLTLIMVSCSKDGGGKNGPSITSINPSSVLTGDMITISGKNLSEAKIFIGGIDVLSVENTSTSVMAGIPSGAKIGEQEVLLQTPSGKTTSKITVTGKGAPPVITSVTPNPASVGETITIQGTGLSKCYVEVYQKPAKINSNTATSVNVTIPAGIPKGSAAVSVLTSLGHTVTSIGIK